MVCAIVCGVMNGGVIDSANAQQIINPGTPVILPAQPIVQQIDTKTEYLVKGVYVFNFARYVTWPASKDVPATEFRVGIIGDSPISVPLDTLATKKKKSVQDRRTGTRLPLRILQFKTLSEYKDCHIFVIPRTVSTEQRQAIQKRFRNKPVLLVGESSGFAQAGGTAGFVMMNGGIKFDLNVADAQRKGLKLDAKLLSLANAVVQTLEPNAMSTNNGVRQ